MPKVEPLIGDYCPACAMSLRDFQLAKYSIIIMCPEDQDKLLNNGDMDLIEDLIEKTPMEHELN